MRYLRLVVSITLVFLLSQALTFAGEISMHIDLSKGSQSSVIIPSGNMLKVTAPGNRAEGYEWNSSSSEQMIITKSGETVYVPEGKDGKSGGRYYLQFKSSMPGKALIKLDYAKPGEAPIQSYVINVTVPAVPDIDQAFDLIDVNRDNSITIEEFLAAPEIPVVVDVKGRLSIPVLTADANSDGVVTAEEIRRSLFSYFDRNSDKVLTREEVVMLAGGAFIRLALPVMNQK